MPNPIMGRYEAYLTDRKAQIAFNIMRKRWARNLLKQAGLHEPGQETLGEFREFRYRVGIGKRGGIRIHLLGRIKRVDLPVPLKTENLIMVDALSRVGL